MPALINSDDGVVSGSSGLKTTGANDGILALQNNGTTNVTVTAAGNVGIGTSSPARRLDVRGGIGMQVNEDGAGTKVISLRSDFAGVGPAVNVTTNDPLLFLTNNTEQARITAAGLFQFNSGYGSVATAYGCRAWVNFDGTGTVAIRASGNVSSITDNGTGLYTLNFTNAFVDVNYSGVFGCNDNGNTSTICYRTGGTKTTSAFQISTASGVAVLADNNMCMVAVFR
jgi:hypothetical protein